MILAAGILLFTACGLPSTAFLAPPILPGTSFEGPETNRVLFFAHNGANDFDDFEGYDLWYKLYRADTAGEDLLRGDESHIEATPLQPGSGRLQARGFRRAVALRRDDSGNLLRFDDTRPTIPMNPTSSSVLFQLDLRPPVAREPQPSARNAEVTVVTVSNGALQAALRRRNVGAETVTDPTGEGGFFGFWDASRYLANQSDMYSAILQNFADTTIPGDLIIVFYALTVGLDRSQASFTRFYSEPVRLEQAQITFTGGF
ncbi:MAG: hypothetical protein EA427_07340 [Spirochaetaceae bacterium]|nr:MAG: hypothetical protein EA427_07340 [Spirochaetaceae bacterium]